MSKVHPNLAKYGNGQQGGESAVDTSTGILRRCVSIQYCTLLLCVTCVALTASACVMLAVASADEAIEAKDSQSRAALSAFNDVSRESVGKLTEDFVGSIADSTARYVGNYLTFFVAKVKGLIDEISLWEQAGIDDHRFESFYPVLKGRLWSDWTNFNRLGTTGMGFVNGVGDVIWMFEDAETMDNPPDGFHHVLTTVGKSDNPGLRYTGSAMPYDGGLNYSIKCCYLCTGDPSSRPPDWTEDLLGRDGACLYPEDNDQRQTSWYRLGMSPFIKPHEPRWAQMTSVGQYVGVSPLGVWTKKSMGSERRGAVVNGFMLGRVQSIFADAVASTAQGSKLRIWAVVASDWVYDSFARLLGPTATVALGIADQTRLMTGASHGESAYLFWEYNAEINCAPCKRRAPRLDTNATDGLIAQAATYINGSYADYSTTQEIRLAPQNGSAEERFLLRVGGIADSAGTNWSLAVLIDVEYVLGEIEHNLERTKRIVQETDEQVDRDLEQDRFELLLIVAAIAVGFSLISVLYVHSISRPLRLLMREMRYVSEMDLDRVDQGRELSALHEVHEMEISFQVMLANLAEFRKYMPGSILGEGEELGEERLAEHPPPSGGNVTLVFTDIQGSTMLWEMATEAMAVSLKMHNGIIRTQIYEHEGYEVKTVGDAFFVVFSSPEAACRFGLQVQYNLCTADWPEELAESGLPQAERVDLPSGEPLWAGVRIRIGIHMGDCALEHNPTTGRADYFGPPVNTAARIEANSVGGFVGITDTVRDAVGDEVLRKMSGALVPLGVKELKGVSKPVAITGLLPKGLEARADLVDETGKVKEPEKKRLSCAVSDASNMSPKSTQMRSPTRRESQNAPQFGRASMAQKKAALVASVMKGGKAVQDKLVQKLSTSVGAVAQLLMPLDWDDYLGADLVLAEANSHVAAVELAADRTEGLMQSVFGSGVMVTWNAGRKSNNPADQSKSFVRMLFRRFGEAGRDMSTTVGISKGPLLQGNVGGSTRGARRYATVCGCCVELASALSASAVTWGAFALCTGFDHANETNTNVRPITRWRLGGEGGTIVTVCELRATKDRAKSVFDYSPQTQCVGTPASPLSCIMSAKLSESPWVTQEYVDAFAAGDVEVVREFALERSDDLVMVHLASLPRCLDPIEAWWIRGLQVPEGALVKEPSFDTRPSDALSARMLY